MGMISVEAAGQISGVPFIGIGQIRTSYHKPRLRILKNPPCNLR